MSRFRVHPVPSHGAEDVAVSRDGWVYTGTEDGLIYRLSLDGARVERVADTGGRPLGIEIAADGRLLVCDSRKGLLWVSPDDGAVETITDRIDGVPMRFCNNAAIASDGTIWFSDSSLFHGIDEWKKDFGRQTRTGRLFRLEPGDEPELVLDGLNFANGVALAADESYVCVAESGGRTVVRYWISGNRAGLRDLLCQQLPGYPDNIARGSDGLIWVTVSSPTDPLVEQLFTAPKLVRRAATSIPEALQPKPKQTVRVQAFDDAGRLVRDVEVNPAEHDARFHMVTGVRERDGRVWMGSLQEPAIAVWDL